MKTLTSITMSLTLALALAACGDDGDDDGNGGTDAATDDAATDAGDTDSQTAAPDCATYCSAITAACTEDNAQYVDEDTCLATCNDRAGFPVGTAEDTEGNTVGCRTYHAGAAATDQPELHCPHAGPTGDNVCGGYCEVYCAIVLRNCTGDNAVYADEAECTTACGAFATDGGNDQIRGETPADTVQCRIYHGSLAQMDPATHCSHSGPDGGGVCVN